MQQKKELIHSRSINHLLQHFDYYESHVHKSEDSQQISQFILLHGLFGIQSELFEKQFQSSREHF